MSFKTIEWRQNKVVMIDQRLLPHHEVYNEYSSYLEVAEAIREMVVRGAPAIGVAAAMGVALGALQSDAEDMDAFAREFDAVCDAMAQTRPTAVNLFWAIKRMKAAFEANRDSSISEIKKILKSTAIQICEDDIDINRRMGRNGAKLLPDEGVVLTHCNAGALATAGYGTALGVIRAAVESGKKISTIADETRPFLQGARLTVWELMKDGIDVTLISDNMSGYLISKGEVDAVIVGADRIAANGDVVNKIGTYMVAALARRHNVPFYVAAPLSTIDLTIEKGDKIPIEVRTPLEVTHVMGNSIAPEGAKVKNPAFDVTPNDLVSAIITEAGVVTGAYLCGLKALFDEA